MNKIKIFLNPIEGREEYLNHIASEGYRLVLSYMNLKKLIQTIGTL